MSFFGINIKKIRQVKGLSQKAFADLFELNRGVISSYEEGRAEPKIETILKVANYFSLNLDKLLTETLQVNQLVSVSDIDHLMFESDKTEGQPHATLQYRNGHPVQDGVMQKILANVDLICEYRNDLPGKFNYRDGDILFLKLEKSDNHLQTVWIDDSGSLHFSGDHPQEKNTSHQLYTITGHLSIGGNNILSGMLARLEKLEHAVFRQP